MTGRMMAARRRSRRGGRAALLLVATLLGCGGEGDPSLRQGLEGLARDTADSARAAADTVGSASESVPAPFPEPQPSDTQPWVPAERALAAGEWTVGVVAAQRPGAGMTTQLGVRLGRQEEWVRVVFDFGDGALPGYHVEYVDEPVSQCGSGDPVKLEGDALLFVRMSPAQAHDEQGRVTVRQRRLIPTNLPVIEEVRLVCDFEGEVAWAIGVDSPNRYRVLELTAPARLVVDIRTDPSSSGGARPES